MYTHLKFASKWARLFCFSLSRNVRFPQLRRETRCYFASRLCRFLFVLNRPRSRAPLGHLVRQIIFRISRSKMHRVRRIVEHPKFKRFWTRWRILMWKAVLMRLHCPLITALEVVIAVTFSLQIRLMFEPSALRSQVIQMIIAKSHTRQTGCLCSLVHYVQLC